MELKQKRVVETTVHYRVRCLRWFGFVRAGPVDPNSTHTQMRPQEGKTIAEKSGQMQYMVIIERRRKATLNSQLRIEGIARRSLVLGGFAEEELFYKMGKGFGFWVRVGKGKG